jgi:putative colanic acid biosynthesis UDP-glucose lipid carrier transferase
MNIAPSNRLGESAERTTFELDGNMPAQAGAASSDALAKWAQGRHPNKNSRLSNAADVSEMYRSESPYFERSWRWPLYYRSIEALAIFVDALIIVTAGVLADGAYCLITAAMPIEISIYGGGAAVVAALVTCLLKERGLYKPNALLNWTAQVRAVTIAWIGVFMFLAGCVFALKIGSTFSRATIISFVGIGLCGLVAHRTFWRTILENGLASGKLSGRTVVLISDNQPVSSLQELLLRHGFRVRRHFVVSEDRSHPSPWDAVISEAIFCARHSNIGEIFIAAEPQNWTNLREMAERLRLLPLPVHLILVGPTSELLKRPVSAIGGTPVIELQRAPLNTFELLIKRTLDILLAGTALIALILILALVAIAVKLETPGPIIFRQTRHGFNGKPFQILKFRTMNALEDGASVKQAHRFDKRVTRVGAWLRRTSIDELPQLINVLRGEMSIVGPRPHAAAHDNHFDEVIANYAFRQRMKPGITGNAQVNGSRGETPTVEAMQRRVEHDIWYIDNWSVGLDLAIMFRTMIEIVRGRNAY